MIQSRGFFKYYVLLTALLIISSIGCAKAAPGLTGLYWNMEFSNPEQISGRPSCDPVAVDKIDFTFGQGIKPHGITCINVEHWTVRYVGFIKIPTNGTYRFSTTTDDGVNLIIDDTIVFKKSDTDKYPYWRHQPHEMLNEYCVHATGDGVHSDLNLQAGYHRIVMDYWEWLGRSTDDRDPCKLEWAGPPTGGLTTFQVVPVSNLFTEHYSKDPVITVAPSITASKTSVNPAEQVTFTISALDSDTKFLYDTADLQFETISVSDDIVYSWSSSDGQSGNSPVFTWTAPNSPGSYTISVRISDAGKFGPDSVDGGFTDKTITVNVEATVTYDYKDDNESAFAINPSSQSVLKTTPGSSIPIAVTAKDADKKLINGVYDSLINDNLSFKWTATGGSPTSRVDNPVAAGDGTHTSTLTWTAPSQLGSYMVSVVANDDEPSDGIGADDPCDSSKQMRAFEVQVQEVVSWQPTHSYSSPISGDIDGDGLEELIVVGTDGKLHAWNGDGSYVTGWPQNISAGYTAGLTKWPTAAIGDIDGDGDLEVVVGSPDSPSVYAFHGDGTVVAGWPQQTQYAFKNAPVVADIQCDDISGQKANEVLAVDSGGNVYLWAWNHHPDTSHRKSSLLWTDTLTTSPVVVSASPVIADLDMNGISDIIVGTETDNKLYAIKGDTHQACAGWPQQLGGAIESTAATQDLNGDNHPDVVVGCNDGKLHVFISQGPGYTSYASYSVDLGGPSCAIKSSPAIVALNTGEKDIVFGSTNGRLYSYLWDSTTTTLVPTSGWSGGNDLQGGAIYSSPVVADLDNDNDVEILVGTDGGKLAMVHHDGQVVNDSNWPKNVVGKVRGAPLLANLDSDACGEIVAGAHSGSIHKYDLTQNLNNILWPSFRHDKSGTGSTFTNKAQYASIAGVVTTGTNTIVSKATVQVLNQDGTEVAGASCLSKEDGTFLIRGITIRESPGYRVQVSKNGYTPTTLPVAPSVVTLNQNGQLAWVAVSLPQVDTKAVVIDTLLPAGTVTNTRRPSISAHLADLSDDEKSGINVDSIVMLVDKRRVSAVFTADSGVSNQESGTASYTPDADLTYGLHLVEVSVKDRANNGPTTAVWSFFVNAPVSTDSSSWGCFKHDPQHTGFQPVPAGAQDGGGENLTLTWRGQVPTCQDGGLSPSHLKPGGYTEILKHPYLDSSPVFFERPDGTDVVYVGWYNPSGNGGIKAYYASPSSPDPQNYQTPIWTYTTGNNDGSVSGTPVVAKIGNEVRIFFGTTGGNLYAIKDLGQSASKIWSVQTETSQNKKPIYGSPVLGDGFIYYGHEEGTIYRKSASDNTDTPAPQPVYALDGAKSKIGPSSIAYEKTVDGHDIIYVGADTGRLYRIDMSTNPCGIQSVALGGPVESSPTIVDGVAYVGVTLDYSSQDMCNLYAIDVTNLDVNATDLKVKWKRKLDGEVVTTPTVVNGKVFVGTHKGTLYALNTKLETLWEKNLGNYILSSCAVTGSGILYAACCDNNDLTLKASNLGPAKIYAFDLSSDPIKELASYEVPGTTNTSFRSSPTVAYVHNSGVFDRWVYITTRANNGEILAFKTPLVDRITYSANPAISTSGIAPKEVTVKPGSFVTFDCLAEDYDTRFRNGKIDSYMEDQVEWTWEVYDSSGSKVDEGVGESFKWFAPDVTDNFTIKCILDDKVVSGISETGDSANDRNLAIVHVIKPSDTGSIRGRVTRDSLNGDPVENALVTAGPYQIYTGENGEYEFLSVELGTYTVSAAKDLFTGDRKENIVVGPSTLTPEVNLVLTAVNYARIRGKVCKIQRDPDNNQNVTKTSIGVPNAVVTLCEVESDNSLTPKQRATADALGNYVFDIIPLPTTKPYALKAERPGYGMRNCESGDVATRWPVDVIAAEWTELDPCMEAEVENPPALNILSPVPDSTGNPNRVENQIRCTLIDDLSGIDIETIAMKLDGVDVIPVCDKISDLQVEVRYTPISVLAADWHEVEITACDNAGNRLRDINNQPGWRSWRFQVTTSPMSNYERSWPMFHRDARHSGFIQGPPNDPANESLTVGWTAEHPTKQYEYTGTVEDVDSSPVFCGATGHVYAGTYADAYRTTVNNSVYVIGDLRAYDAATGKLVWKFPSDLFDGTITTKRYIGAVSSTPAVAKVGIEDNTYRVFCLSQDGHLYSVYASDSDTTKIGKECWQYPNDQALPLEVPEAFPSSPTLDDNGAGVCTTVYFTARDGETGKLFLYAINATNGVERWKCEIPSKDENNATPTLDGQGNLYVRAGIRLYKFTNINGTPSTYSWEYEVGGGPGSSDNGTYGYKYTCAAPALNAAGDRLFIGVGTAHVACYDLTKSPIDSGFIFWNKYTSDGDYSGTVSGIAPVGGEVASTPAVAPLGNLLHIFIGTCSGRCIDMDLNEPDFDDQGELIYGEPDAVWEGTRGYQAYVSTSPAVTGSGIIYAGCDSGKPIGAESQTMRPGAVYAVRETSTGTGTWAMGPQAVFAPTGSSKDTYEDTYGPNGESTCVRSSPCIGYLYRNGKIERWVYISTRADGGTLIAFRPDPNQQSPECIVQGYPGNTWTSMKSGESGVTMERVRLKATGGETSVKAFNLYRTGTAADQTGSPVVSKVKLVKDVNGNGYVDSEDTILAVKEAFTAGTRHKLVLSEPITLQANDYADVLVAFDISLSAPNGTVGVRLKDEAGTPAVFAVEIDKGSTSPENIDIQSPLVEIVTGSVSYKADPSISAEFGCKTIVVKGSEVKQNVTIGIVAHDFDEVYDGQTMRGVVEDALVYSWHYILYSNGTWQPISLGENTTGKQHIPSAWFMGPGVYRYSVTVDDMGLVGANDDPQTREIDIIVVDPQTTGSVLGTLTSSADNGVIPGALVSFLYESGWQPTGCIRSTKYYGWTDDKGCYWIDDIELTSNYSYFYMVGNAGDKGFQCKSSALQDLYGHYNQGTGKYEAKVDLVLDPQGNWNPISGRVLKPGPAPNTWVGVAGATVYSEENASRVTTASDGSYTLFVPPSVTTTTVYAEYEDWNRGQRAVSAVPATDQDIQIGPRRVSIKGTVKYTVSLIPVEGADVTVDCLGIEVARAKTDDQGNYSVKGLETGPGREYIVSASKGLLEGTSNAVAATNAGEHERNILIENDNAGPVISECVPTGSVGVSRPVITAKVVDAGTGVDASTVKLYIRPYDDNFSETDIVQHTYNPATGWLKWAQDIDLNLDETYYVKIEAKDLVGNVGSHVWSFTRNTATGDFRVNLDKPYNGEAIEPTELDGYPIVGDIYTEYTDAFPIKYDFKVRRAGTQDQWVTVASGSVSENKENYTLCYWNTRAIVNGSYEVKLFAEDSLQRKDESDSFITCQVSGTLKVGEFKYVEEPDISASFREGIPFEVRRVYNSRKISSSPFYYGWTWAYDIELEEHAVNPSDIWRDWTRLYYGNVTIRRPDGDVMTFKAPKNNNLLPIWSTWHFEYEAPAGVQMKLERVVTGGCSVCTDDNLCYVEFHLTGKDGVTYVFKNNEPRTYYEQAGEGEPFVFELKKIQDRYGNYVDITHNGESMTVTTSDGRSIELVDYDDPNNPNDPDGLVDYAELKAGGTTIQRVDYKVDLINDAKTWRVEKSGQKVANENGVLVNMTVVSEYRYDDSYRLEKIVRPNQEGHPERPYIQNRYGADGTLEMTKEWVNEGFFRIKTSQYSMSDTSAETTSGIYVGVNAAASVKSMQNENGAVTSNTVWNGYNTTPGTELSTTTLSYNNQSSGCELLPTNITNSLDINGDGAKESLSTTMTYWPNSDPDAIGGDLASTEQATDSGTITTSFGGYNSYHEPSSITSKQGYDAGKDISTTRYYGPATGDYDDEPPFSYGVNDKYLRKVSVLVDDTPATDVYADTEYTYYSGVDENGKPIPANGLIETMIGPDKGGDRIKTTYTYDKYGFLATTSTATIGLNPTADVLTSRSVNDAHGNILLSVGGSGEVTKFSYDDLGRLWKQETFNDPDWRNLSEDQFKEPSRYSSPLTTTVYGYDKNGNQAMTKVYTTNESLPSVWKRSVYNRDNSEVHSSNMLSGMQKSTAYIYDSLEVGYVRTVEISGKNGNGDLVRKLTWHHYDSMGRLSRIEYYNGTSVIKQDKYSYYADGSKSKIETLDGSGNNVLTQKDFLYDKAGRLTQTTVTVGGTANALESKTTYDAAGNVTISEDPDGNKTHYEYDNANRLLWESFPTSSDVKVKRVVYEYCSSGELKQQTQYDTNGTTELAKSQYAYHDNGRLSQVRQWLDGSNWTITTYDYADTPDEEFSVIVSGETFKFDERIIDAEKRCTYYAHDPQGKTTMALYPTMVYEKFFYFNDGKLRSKTVYKPGKGGAEYSLITYSYDQAGRLQSKCYPDDNLAEDVPNGIAPEPMRIDYSYDDFGRLVKITDRRTDGHAGDFGSTITYKYDAFDRVTTVKLQDDRSIVYSYYPTGLRESVEVRDSSNVKIHRIEYQYDKAGRMIEVREDQGTMVPIATYEYGKEGYNPTIEITYEHNNSPFATRKYVNNPSGWVNSITNRIGSTDLSVFDYNMIDPCRTDGLGRKRVVRETLARTGGSGSDVFDITYGYDNLSRLTSYEVKRGTEVVQSHDYGYDNVGNRQWIDNESILSNNSTYYLALLTEPPTSGVESDLIMQDPLYYFGKLENNAVNSGFDANGNLIRRSDRSDPNDYWLYTYDYDNHLVRADRYENNGSIPIISVAYTYDVLGNLVKRDAGGGTVTTYTVDVAKSLPVVLVENHTIPGITTTTKYTYGNDLLKISRSNDGDYYYFSDALGSVRTVTDSNGNVKCRYVYDPYGSPATETIEDVTWNNFLFTGQLYDRTTRLIYLRARHYDPETGRFVQRDTYEGDKNDPLSLHRYVYCQDNPINMVDPSGEDGTIMGFSASSAIFAGLVGLTAVVNFNAQNYATSSLMEATWTANWSVGSSAAESAESVLSIAHVSTKILIEQAKEILKATARATGELLRPLKVIPIPESTIPHIAEHVADAQDKNHPRVLKRCGFETARANRARALKGRGSAGLGKSWDEYPFASSYEGGQKASVEKVPLWENCVQGGIIAACYIIERITLNTSYYVVVIPSN